ncbi:hypothetical protein CDAR_259531 [Caerostris darwini]|uniref:Uncharacterized protein n=1 Tax=Caerostris darwini TaxID=1538125 RepID=A0AAV4VNZ1_9ARAC|nr:hypothetical protein CDAR_259531 [Caerostris darwini]
MQKKSITCAFPPHFHLKSSRAISKTTKQDGTDRHRLQSITLTNPIPIGNSIQSRQCNSKPSVSRVQAAAQQHTRGVSVALTEKDT